MEVSIPDYRCEDAEELQNLLVDSFLTTNLFPILIFTCSWSFSDLLNTRLVPILVIFTVYTKHHLHCFSALWEVHFKVSRPRLLPFLRSPALCIQKFSLNCCGWNEAFEISKQNGAFAHCQLPSLKNWSSGAVLSFSSIPVQACDMLILSQLNKNVILVNRPSRIWGTFINDQCLAGQLIYSGATSAAE